MSRKRKSKPVRRARSSSPRGANTTNSPRRRWPGLADLMLWSGFTVIPLIFVPGLADEFRLPKLAAAELLFGVSCLALVARGAIDLGSERRRAYLWATVPFVVIAFASVIAGNHADHGRIALWSLLFGWLVGLCWSGRDLTLEKVLWMMTPGAVVVAAIAVVQALGWWSPIMIEESRRRLQVTSTIGNTGELASFLVLPAIFAAWRALRAWNRGEARTRRFGWAIAFGVFVAAVTATQTATALLLIAVVTAGLIATQPRRPVVRVGLLLVAVVAVGAVLLSPAASRVAGKLGELARGEWAELTTGRTDGWMVAGELLDERPLLGVGFGGFAAEYTITKVRLAERGATFYTRHVGQSTFSNAHSEPLEVAAEMGWLGLLALAWLTIVILAPLRGRWKAAHEQEGRERALLHSATLLAMMGLAATYFPMRTALLAYPFLFCFLALLPTSWFLSSTEARKEAPESRLEGSRRWLLAAVVVLLLVQSGRVSWQRIRSSAELRVAELVGQSMIQNGIRPAALRGMIPTLERAWERTPWDERIPQALAGYYVLLRDGEKARDWYERSFAVAYRPETIDSMGRLLHRAGRTEESVPWFVRAVRLDRLRIRAVPSDVRDQVRSLAAAPAVPENRL